MSRKRCDGWGPVNHVWWQTKRARIDKGAGVGACDRSKPVVFRVSRQDSFPVLRGGWRGVLAKPKADSRLEAGGAGVLDAVSQEGRE